MPLGKITSPITADFGRSVPESDASLECCCQPSEAYKAHSRKQQAAD